MTVVRSGRIIPTYPEAEDIRLPDNVKTSPGAPKISAKCASFSGSEFSGSNWKKPIARTKKRGCRSTANSENRLRFIGYIFLIRCYKDNCNNCIHRYTIFQVQKYKRHNPFKRQDGLFNGRGANGHHGRMDAMDLPFDGRMDRLKNTPAYVSL